MPLSSFILYAIPAIFMAGAGYFIPTIDIAKAYQYLSYTLCVLLTFVFKYYADAYFKKNETTKAATKIRALESENKRLSDELAAQQLEHANELSAIERRLNDNLKTNYKCTENESLWSGVDEVIKSVEQLSDNARNKMAKSKNRTNRKKKY
jgi:hypothetical protein